MKIIIEFDGENEKEYIEYFKSLDQNEKHFLKWTAKNAVIEEINEELERKERRDNQGDCVHDYEEYQRKSSNDEGERYIDDDGEYDTVELIYYSCKKCEHVKTDWKYSNVWTND